MKKVLVACEESQAVCIEFRRLGIEAYSCDLLPSSGGHPEWHFQQNVIHKLYEDWDLIIAHPPCTRLCNSGVRWLHERNLWNDMYEACEFFNIFQSIGKSGVPIAIENPTPHKYAVEYIGKPNQYIQPYEHGHTETKKTGLWLYNLPEIKQTNNVYEEMMKLPYAERSKVHYASPGQNRSVIRSKTYTGIAKAMAEQWGAYILNK